MATTVYQADKGGVADKAFACCMQWSRLARMLWMFGPPADQRAPVVHLPSVRVFVYGVKRRSLLTDVPLL